MKKKEANIYIGILIAFLFVMTIGVSYALWKISLSQTDENVLASDCFSLSFEETETLNLKNVYPVYDEDGKKLTPYTFTLQNNCSRPTSFEILLETTSNTTLKSEYLKVMINKNVPVLYSSLESRTVTIANGKEARKIETGVIDGNSTLEYQVRLWIDENVTVNSPGIMNSKFEGKITIVGSYLEYYKEGILNGTDPVITGRLIPIKLTNDGTVTKADMKQEWYSYTNKEWANAVILKDESISYNNGDIIPENNIESYFVWIPRYKYKIFNDGNYPSKTNAENKVQTIEVVFENKNTTVSTGSTVGTWLTHPAFISFDTNGMWVGKYETSKSTGSDNERNSEAVQIKPNVSSWRSINVANAFYSSYDYKRDLESHMMKNTEWGAVAYLQHSVYGSEASVRINNHSSYVTGYAANNEPTCGYTGTNEACNIYCNDGSCNKPYNTETGYLASTTANITGIYDMSGGAWEYVMGVLADQQGNPMSGRNSKNHSGFNGTLGCPDCDSNTSGVTSITDGYEWPEAKYYDKYAYSTSVQQYNRRILGDATGEMGPFGDVTYLSRTSSIGSWYADYAYFVSSYTPWFLRGSTFHDGSNSGVFAFTNVNGYFNSYVSFRVVLTP